MFFSGVRFNKYGDYVFQNYNLCSCLVLIVKPKQSVLLEGQVKVVLIGKDYEISNILAS